MRKVSYFLVLVGLFTLSGCAVRRPGVVIDPNGVDMAQYQQDLADCQAISRQVHEKAGRGAVGGAVVGGAIGGVLGGHEGAERGVGVGAISGLVHGAAATRRERERVVKNCLRYRGYRVLN